MRQPDPQLPVRGLYPIGTLRAPGMPGTVLSSRDVVRNGPDTALELPVLQGKQTPVITVACDE